MGINTEVCDTLTEDTNFNSMKTLFEDRFDSKNDVENQCIQRLKNTLNYDGERYTSKLPFVKNPDLLPDNYILAKHRTDNLLKNLRKQPELLKEYDRIISDYIKDMILEEVPIDFKTVNVHCLPHRAVVKEDRETTKVRIVFDASAKYKNELSVSDPGPCLLPHIFDILLRFRLGKIAMVSDIKQAFLQICMDENDRNYLRVMWFDNALSTNPTMKLL